MHQAGSQTLSPDNKFNRPPGFLLAPFGWATAEFLFLLQQSPDLLPDLLHLSRIRMHLIALALAHLDGNVSREHAHILIRGSAGEILHSTLGRRPVGLKRVVGRLPESVLEASNYRRLVQLLDDPSAAKMLHHAATIDDAAIVTLDDVPAGLRSLVFAMQAWLPGMDSFAVGLRCLVRRGCGASVDALIAELGSIRQPQQLIAKLTTLVEGLPLPCDLPPLCVGQARRLDRANEIRELAKRWRNCLGNYIWRVDAGECAIYLWEGRGIEAACLARRRGRLGWFLEEVLGPRNMEIAATDLEAITAAFDAAEMPLYDQIRAIEDIIEMAGACALRRRPRRPSRKGSGPTTDCSMTSPSLAPGAELASRFRVSGGEAGAGYALRKVRRLVAACARHARQCGRTFA